MIVDLTPLFEGDPLFALIFGNIVLYGALAILLLVAVLATVVLSRYGVLWFQAYMSSADVKLLSMIGMSLRKINPATIILAKIMARQAGLNIDRVHGISTAQLETHALAGGDVTNVVIALVAADRAGIDLDFDRATAINLAGRDVLDAVRTSVSPKVIDCPEVSLNGRTTLSAVAKNGVEMRIRVRVTVRMNLAQLIGGATESTIVARVGQGIVSSIGSSASHMDVLAMPSRITEAVQARGLDAGTAFEIVSVDIISIDVGDNIGARLRSIQAESDMRVALAAAESRRAEAIALQHEMKASLAHSRALLVLAEAEIPPALAEAFRQGRLNTRGGVTTLRVA